jgi:hypothetical protein
MEEDEDDQCYAIKCGLARLGARPLIRNGIDHVASSIQRLSARASLFANHCVLHYIRNDYDVSSVFTQKWWHNAITRFVTLEKSSDPACAYPEMTLAFEDFQTHGPIDFITGDYYWSFIATLARDMLTNAKVMVARQFHNLLSKTASRLISFWELESGYKLKKGLAYAAHKHFHHELFGSRVRSKKRAALPVDFPTVLRDLLTAKAGTWKTKYPQVCATCAKPAWIKSAQLPAILRWENEILMEKNDYLRRVQHLKKCTKRKAYGFMRKGSMKASLLLPVSSPDVKHISFSPTTLRDFYQICENNIDKLLKDASDVQEKKEALLYLQPITSSIRTGKNLKSKNEKAARKQRVADQAARRAKGENADEPERKRRKIEGDELIARESFNMGLFRHAFPRLEKLKPRAKFKMYLRTDGVACSIIYERKVPQIDKSAKEVLCPTERRDLESPNPPIIPMEHQRLIGIDPGRRDMVVAIEHNTGAVLKMSTRRHAHESGRSNAKALTLKIMRKTIVHFAGESLSRTLSRSPPTKEVESESWSTYLTFILPILDVRAQAYRTRAIRRMRFENFMKRDKSLDLLCNRLCSLGRGSKDEPTLIAFGDGSHCSTGFGHAPAPQRRFRKRLEQIHGARITLIHEAYTSQKCSYCHSQLEAWKCKTRDSRCKSQMFTTMGDSTCSIEEVDRFHVKEIHGVRVCRNCRGKDNHPRFWHRDVNSARNMISIYLSLARDRTRPECFKHNE